MTSIGLPERFKLNTLSNYGNAFVSVLLALAVTPILTRGLGQEAFGVWATVTTSVLYFDFLRFSSDLATVNYVAGGRALGDQSQIQRTVATSFYALGVPAGVLLLLTPALVFFVPAVTHVSPDLRTAAMVLAVCSVLDLVAGIPADTFGATIVGFQRFDLLNITLAATALSQAAAWTVIIMFGGGLIAIGVATLTLSLCSQLVRYTMVRRLAGRNVLSRENFDRSLVRPILRVSLWMAVTDLSVVVITRLDVVIVAIILGVKSAAIYAVAAKLAALVDRFAGPGTSVFFPWTSGLAATGDREGLRQALFTGTRVSLAIATPLAVVLMVLAGPLLAVWVPKSYGDGLMVVVYLAASELVAASGRMALHVLQGMRDVKTPALINLTAGVLNLGLSIGLGLTLGIEGVALATLISAVLMQVIRHLYVCRRLETSSWRLLAVVLHGNVVAGGAAAAIGFLLRDLIAGHAAAVGVLEVLAAAAVMVATYAAVMVVAGVNRQERRALAQAVRIPWRGTAAT